VLTLVDAEVSDNGGGNGPAVYNVGALTVVGSTIRNNSDGGGLGNTGVATVISSTIADNVGASGAGGISNSGSLTVTASAVVGNSNFHGVGGGLYNSGVVTLTNSTVSGNSVSGGPASGGGLYNDRTGTAVLSNVTVSDNEGNAAGGIGGVDNSSGGTVALVDTILAGNTPPKGGAVGGPDCYGTLTSRGHNLLGAPAGCAGLVDGVNGDRVGTAAASLDPLLGPLGDNGGPTRTRALLPGSPAIDAGDPAGCRDAAGALLTTDQRGLPRPYPQGGRCDIGAYEDQGAAGPGGPAATPELGSGELLVTGLLPLGLALLVRRQRARRARGR